MLRMTTQARAAIDWRRLHDEGARVTFGSDTRDAAGVFVVPFDAQYDAVVLVLPCARALTDQVRSAVVHVAECLRAAGGVWAWLRAPRGRIT